MTVAVTSSEDIVAAEYKLASVPKRLPQIECLRGIAALSVMWFHLTNGFTDGSFLQLSGMYGWLGVEIFFVVSGFVIPYAMLRARYIIQNDFVPFMVRRLVRLEPPYLASIGLVLVLWYLAELVPLYSGDDFVVQWKRLASHFFYLTGILEQEWYQVVYWSLAIEFQFYLAMALIFPLLNHINGWLRGVVIVSALMAGVILPDLLFLPAWFGLFGYGIATLLLRVGKIKYLEWGLWCLACTVQIFLVLGVGQALVGIAAVLVILFADQWRFKPLIFVGTFSYSIYLIHVPVGGKIINLGRRWLETSFEHWLLVLMAASVCLFGAWVFYRLLEIPSLRLSAYLRSRFRM